MNEKIDLSKGGKKEITDKSDRTGRIVKRTNAIKPKGEKQSQLQGKGWLKR